MDITYMLALRLVIAQDGARSCYGLVSMACFEFLPGRHIERSLSIRAATRDLSRIIG